MAIYEYRCGEDGPFEVTRPLGTQPQALACPACGSAAARVFSAPMLSSSRRDLAAAIEHSEKTRHEPDLVTSVPRVAPRRRTPVVPLTPALARLPRP